MTVSTDKTKRKTRSIDDELAEFMVQFYAAPLDFVMFAYDWSNPAIQIVPLVEPWASKYDSKFGPDAWACEFLDEVGKAVKERNFNGIDPVDPIQHAVSSGNGIGKSTITAWLVDWIMSTRPFAQGTVTANSGPQLETKTWAQIAKWTRMCVTSHWFRLATGRGSMKMVHKEYPESWFCSAQTCREENSESFAGQHAANSTSFYINDEASAIPDVIWEVEDFGMTDGEPMRFAFGNPTRTTGRFRECFRSQRHRWVTRQIDSRDVQITNKRDIDQKIEDEGIDSDYIKIHVLGQFPSASAYQFIGDDLVQESRRRKIQPKQYEFAPKIITCDPAWTGDDELVIGMRQGLYFQVLDVIRKNDNDMAVANLLARREDEYGAHAVFIDGGFGTGIVSAGKSLRRDWRLVWFSEKSGDVGCRNKRAEMWNEMKKWLQAGGVLPNDQQLCDELTYPETIPRLDGKLQLESKDQIKRRKLPSPNRADALALSFAYNVSTKAKIVHMKDFMPSNGIGL